MLAEKIALPEYAWGRLNLMWVGYFLIVGAANLYVALEFSREAWGSFRVFGIYGALLVFMVIQGIYIYRHMAHETPPATGSQE